MNTPPPRPPARRTFGARRVTRAALVLLVAGVLLAAVLGHVDGRKRSNGPVPRAPLSSGSPASPGSPVEPSRSAPISPAGP